MKWQTWTTLSETQLDNLHYRTTPSLRQRGGTRASCATATATTQGGCSSWSCLARWPAPTTSWLLATPGHTWLSAVICRSRSAATPRPNRARRPPCRPPPRRLGPPRPAWRATRRVGTPPRRLAPLLGSGEADAHGKRAGGACPSAYRPLPRRLGPPPPRLAPRPTRRAGMPPRRLAPLLGSGGADAAASAPLPVCGGRQWIRRGEINSPAVTVFNHKVHFGRWITEY
uniref:Uncharacterized protein n=14 Tax=Aegilops tauschii subsp. strangulata TaxID=200361 RepID=A0A453CVI2_AEGTS